MEEEFFLVNLESLYLEAEPDPHIYDMCQQLFGDRVSHELFLSQLEVATPSFPVHFKSEVSPPCLGGLGARSLAWRLPGTALLLAELRL